MKPIPGLAVFKNRWPIFVGGLFGLIALILVNAYVHERERALDAARRKALEGMRGVPVAVATRDIKEGTALTEEMVRLREVPERFMQPYVVQGSIQGVIGQIAVAPIAQDEQILSTKLKRRETNAAASSKIPAGKRAVTIETDPISAVNGFVHPGDHVDVLWTFTLPTPKGTQPVTVTLFQNVLVLALGNQMVEGGPASSQGVSGTITFALAPDEIETLLFARQGGKLHLSLRAHSDTDTKSLTPASLETLLRQAFPQAVPAPVPPPPAPRPPRMVEIYRGLQRDVVSLAEDQ